MSKIQIIYQKIQKNRTNSFQNSKNTNNISKNSEKFFPAASVFPQVLPGQSSRQFFPAYVFPPFLHASIFPHIDAPFIGTAPLLLCLVPPTGRRALPTRPYPADSFSHGCTLQPGLKLTQTSLSHRQFS